MEDAIEGEVLGPESGALATRDTAGAVQPVQSVMEQAAIAELKIAAQVAKMYPRNLPAVRQTLMEACKRPKFAETARYAKPTGGSTIRGLSVRFAEEAMRTMGNLRVDELVIHDDDEQRITRVTAWDCETMAHSAKTVVVRKVIERKNANGREVVGPKEGRPNSYGEKVYLVRATDDEVLTKEAALCSKVRRNLILSLIPSDIREDAEQQVIKTAADRDAQDPKGEMKKIVDGFSALRVKVESLERFLGHPIDEASPAEIGVLREVYTSVRDGEASFAQHLEQREAEREQQQRREPTRGDASAAQQQSRARQQGARAGAQQQQERAPQTQQRTQQAPPAAPTQQQREEEQPPPPEEEQAPPAAQSSRSRGRRGATAAKPSDGTGAAEDALPTEKEADAWLASVKKATGNDGDILTYAFIEVFDGAESPADVPLRVLKEKHADMVERVKALDQPMGGDMSDRVFNDICNAHPDSVDGDEERDEVQKVINAVCGRFGVSTMEDWPVWAQHAWRTCGATTATTPAS